MSNKKEKRGRATSDQKMTLLKTLGLKRFDRFVIGRDKADFPIIIVYYGNDQWAHSGVPWKLFDSAYILAFWGAVIERQLRNG